MLREQQGHGVVEVTQKDPLPFSGKHPADAVDRQAPKTKNKVLGPEVKKVLITANVFLWARRRGQVLEWRDSVLSYRDRQLLWSALLEGGGASEAKAQSLMMILLPSSTLHAGWNLWGYLMSSLQASVSSKMERMIILCLSCKGALDMDWILLGAWSSAWHSDDTL